MKLEPESRRVKSTSLPTVGKKPDLFWTLKAGSEADILLAITYSNLAMNLVTTRDAGDAALGGRSASGLVMARSEGRSATPSG